MNFLRFCFVILIGLHMATSSPSALAQEGDDAYETVFAEAVEKFGDDRPIDLKAAEEFLRQREQAVFSEELKDLGDPLPTPSESRTQFCEAIKDPEHFRNLSLHANNRLAFRNHGGLFGGGVCWWHSRLQRAAIYLGVFRPELARPDKSEAKKILTRLIAKSRVVEIPGYRNLKEFSTEWEALIQDRLERWQVIDGFLWQAWIRGLVGSSEVSAENLRKKMDELYDETEGKKRISYVKLQIPGIDAHAWLIVGMKKLPTGYDLLVIDSNFPTETLTVNYQYGATYLTKVYRKFVPYLERTGDFSEMDRALKKYCR